MHIVAKVFDLAITDSEIQKETHKLSGIDSPQERISALNRRSTDICFCIRL